ncbi:MAG: DUF262 domain-containing protein [Candidatus Moeniiplasma glomeromycotorum]|nr:DUF262 domain-containing protein [Candidatus Moeniiplasma glomeromycotorum]MCE8162220.1 DUF262 domain-containing protein [Candidatus Moeniiplasma glomeromycotorum]MCE8166124.1 DUF262 domain-containing protein [Candidatus Moeniiplasma glomeromycotorum]MCE8166619.1 DUF262 domain-containing protein [Candidatus Moeniiplasma glomeromycotorum]
MKDIEIRKHNFNQLMEKLIKDKSRLSLPAYQREYSWDITNWKQFFGDVKEITKTNRNKQTGEQPNIWFIGSIILQKKANGADYDIIDGQQRLITFFILLATIYSVIPTICQDKKRILQFLFYDWYEGWTKDKGSLLQDSLRIELDNPDDQIDLRAIIPFAKSNLLIGREERKRNIIRAKNFFSSKTNTENYHAIYQTILDNFYFSLITLDEETDSEIFMTLNTAGEDLTIPDLVKSLLARQNDYWARQFASIWEEKIVKKICFPPASKKNRSDKVKKFLIVFWEVQENNCYNRTLDDKILRFYRKQIKGDRKIKTYEENRQFLDLLVQHAEVYEKIINADKHHGWWEQNWSEEMFKIVSDISLLDHKELVSLILATHFQFRERTLEEKLTITKELQKLIFYLFRAIIIKGKIEDENALRGIRTNTLKMISSGEVLILGQEKSPIDLIIKEFQFGSESFYQVLKEYKSKKSKEQGIEKFILLTYYQKKIRDKGLKIDWSDYEIKPLVSQNSEIEEISENRNSLGNLTLMKSRDDWSLFPWEEKRLIYRRMGDNCLLNLEEENWTEVEDIVDLITERKKYLIEDFKRLRIFEPD